MDKQAFDLALRSISRDRQSGASELARRCLSIIVESAHQAPSGNTTEFMQLLKQRTAQLVATRPSMAPIESLLNVRVKIVASSSDGKWSTDNCS